MERRLSYRYVCFCGSRFSDRGHLLSHSALSCFSDCPLYCGFCEGKIYCRFCGLLCSNLASRTNHEAIEHLSHQFHISSIPFSGNCLVMSINDQKTITCKEELFSWIKNVPNGIAVADFAEHKYDTLQSDLKDLEHLKKVTILHSDVLGGEVVYPMQQMGVEDELEVEEGLKFLFRNIDVQNIESVNKCLRMQGWKPPTGSSKRAASAAAESKKLNKRSKG